VTSAGQPLFRTLLQTAKAAFALLLITLNTIVLTSLLCVLAIGKWLAPTASVRNFFRRILARIAEGWIGVNNFILARYRNTAWDLQLPDGMSRDGSYLVLCNHRSWVDILVLQRCFNRRLPLLRFFLKKQLIRVPFLGVAWWALDFPFMQRYSRAMLEQYPELKGRDLENARKACEKLRGIPVAMMNFPEGTRFSEQKRDKYGSPYRNLLTPRIGGVGQVLYALGDQLEAVIDVTVAYPAGDGVDAAPTLWDLLAGRVSRIAVRARRLDLPTRLRGRDFRSDTDFRDELEAQVNGLWRDKDALIASLLGQTSPLDGGSDGIV